MHDFREAAGRGRPHGGWSGVEPGQRGRAGGRSLTAVLASLLLAVLLAACGGSSGSPDAAASTPSHDLSPGSRPLDGTLEQAVAEYWRLVDADDFAGVAAASAPDTPTVLSAANDDVVRARLVSTKRLGTQDDGAYGVEATVFVEPSSAATPWGPAGDHLLFMYLEEAPAGGWLVREWGTGP